MKTHTLILLYLLLQSTYTSAQLNMRQDNSDIKWRKVENKHFEVIYPEHAEDQAQYILQLLNYYRDQVSHTYQIKPKKLSLVLRSQLALPNGFVTLAPRRSEWFMSSNFTPFIGSLEWYQSLAIHEYRHVVQLDFLNRGNNRIGYFLFGETILSTLINIGIPTWFFEGDAVWSETRYSDGGRGRSPRFSAHLKSLLISNNTPSYDQLLARDYTTPLPNLYVYGHFLITRGVALYGERFWAQVSARATDEPLNPFAFTDAFFEITQTSFDQFYQETMSDLKQQWSKVTTSTTIKDSKYTLHARPIMDGEELYYFQKDLHHFWQLMQTNRKGKTVLHEFNISPALKKFDIKNKQLIYAQNRPHFRYLYQSYSDLFLYDINEDESQQITANKRYYHPQFDLKGTKILALEYNNQNQWSINILNLAGNILTIIPSTPESKIIEAVWRNETEIIALTLNSKGMKSFSLINIATKKIRNLTPPTRNNIYSLHFKDLLYFEADNLGVVNIFSFDLEQKQFAKCTQESIAASSPFVNKNNLIYLSQNQNGNMLKTIPLNCENIKASQLLTDYIGTTPSDNYSKAAPMVIDNFEKLKSTKISPQNYPEYSKALIPHSWSFLGGRGLGVSTRSSNILGTLSLTGEAGIGAEEATPYAGLALNYTKYYPLLGFSLGHRQRRISVKEKDYTWNENIASLQITLPYLFQNNDSQG